eukprot:CAMPEP_0170617054 /NCGR_PEP_ID=MMETSP0224-20130122/26201_1 /TAXON_ID=285029 /ORGANISM="Togula jolla, Strain CCCM 725" /LENGTH=140 /DNA_ID=CAMNT_0010942897 /DNA_START=146 /DNA_END=570 /DNA_ORIENTATION=-
MSAAAVTLHGVSTGAHTSDFGAAALMMQEARGVSVVDEEPARSCQGNQDEEDSKLEDKRSEARDDHLKEDGFGFGGAVRGGSPPKNCIATLPSSRLPRRADDAASTPTASVDFTAADGKTLGSAGVTNDSDDHHDAPTIN